jgi:hypothetical protein
MYVYVRFVYTAAKVVSMNISTFRNSKKQTQPLKCPEELSSSDDVSVTYWEKWTHVRVRSF